MQDSKVKGGWKQGVKGRDLRLGKSEPRTDDCIKKQDEKKNEKSNRIKFLG